MNPVTVGAAVGAAVGDVVVGEAVVVVVSAQMFWRGA